MSRTPSLSGHRRAPLDRARRDLLVGAVLVASVTLLLASGLRLLGGAPGDAATRTAVLLNVALVLFGWRRYRDLAAAEDERAAVEQRVSALARTDELTGLPTRRSFAEDGAAAIQAGLRRARTPALLVVDLDHFRTVNDLHGHLSGDLVLAQTAERIRRALPSGAIAGRLDGDAFAVLLTLDPRHGAQADALAGHLVGALAQPIVARGLTACVGATIGVATGDGGSWHIDALLRRATLAMRAAKAAGRGRHAWFDAGMERALVERAAMETALRAGIPAGQFVPFYEQQVELGTGRLIGFEVQARWHHPTRGLLPPDQFLGVAEACGLIGELSTAVMRRALTEARDWDPSLSLSVAISPAQLKDPWLAQKLVKLLVETGFPASRLEVAITEAALHQNLSLAQSIVASLKNQGIRLALDDFGAGQSSLAHLRALPFDRIKIDRGFVTGMTGDPGAAAIVTAISRLGESLNLPITAEGIESAGVVERLAAIGCTKGQGRHFGEPLTVAATRRLLAEQGLLPTARAVGGAGAAIEGRRRSA